MRVTVLVSDAFGGVGGIAKFNRDFLTALSDSPDVERVLALPRLMQEPIRQALPEFLVYDRTAAHGKLRFARRVFFHGLAGPKDHLVVCGHINLLPLAWLLARQHGARLALIIHGIEAWTPHSSAVVRVLLRYVDALISVSRYSEQRFRAWSPCGAPPATILPNCVDLGTFAPGPRDHALLKRYGLENSEVLLTVGRLAAEERYKGVDQVLELMPKLLERRPNLRYLIVGDGSDRARLQAKASMLGLAHAVVFAGKIAEQEKVDDYNLASVFVMPSTGEGFGIVLIEAAACGLAIVGSSIDGSREALLDGVLGYLTDPNDPAALELAILAALETGTPGSPAPAIRTFSTEAFRDHVWAWASEQARLACGTEPGSALRKPS